MTGGNYLTLCAGNPDNIMVAAVKVAEFYTEILSKVKNVSNI